MAHDDVIAAMQRLDLDEYRLVDARAAGQRRGHRVDLFDDALADIRVQKRWLAAASGVLRKGMREVRRHPLLIDTAEVGRLCREHRDREEHRQRIAKRAGAAPDDFRQPNAEAQLDLIRKALAAAPIRPAFIYGAR